MRTVIFISCMYIGDSIRKGDLGTYAGGFYLLAAIAFFVMDVFELAGSR